ncbi:short-chain dehydrogenase/reductase SDR [Chloroherpeton thalassium ATCC 35110]|uniref:Short-chain dehydrogenase/reductase SDR n=1 Tax=Chloroherpeton thalassium (strain ATCC 35110 / GB-78) TaxID=517418 RepID=B3QW89_CHLT3|nr:SDR family oxidoreductase [Chloroherpeton thalassium]ACF13202.1 short-chain dehydrogenase/reductase SDR [Chloroherpeton thalassium ATCC 35110]
MTELKEQVAVITGATGGIGKATAELFHANGIRTVLHGRNRARLKDIAAALQAPYVLGDITEQDVPKKLLDTALAEFRRCDIVVNNAAIMEIGTVESVDIEVICKMVRVNVEAAYRVAYTFLKHFKQNDFGHLINISSVLGTKVRESAGAYAGTKYAIEALSEALRIELARTNVKVTSIEPGLVMTELHRKWDVHPKEAMQIPTPLQPGDVAEIIWQVLSQKPHVRIPKILIMPKDHAI